MICSLKIDFILCSGFIQPASKGLTHVINTTQAAFRLQERTVTSAIIARTLLVYQGIKTV